MDFPSDQDLIAYVERENAERKTPVDRRDIARAFGIKGPARTELRATLRRLEDEGKLALDGKKTKKPGQLPPVTVLSIEKMDSQGDLVCKLTKDDSDAEVILFSSEAAKQKPPLGVGDRFLGKLHQDKGRVRATVIKALGKPAGRMLGVFRSTRSGGFVEPVSRKTKTSFEIAKSDTGGAEDGDLVWAEPKTQRGYGPRRGRVAEVIGSVDEQKNLSLIAVAEQDIPVEFPRKVIAESEALDLEASKHHKDLTALPLVTIDPASARDHDDAVHAEELEDGGFRLTVAIADVSYFVRPGTALDREAEKRGNSTYLPDRVIPMLPERLSNDLCSLREGEVRLALCCEIEIGAKGGKKKHRFFRAKIKNHQNLAYEKAQAIEDGAMEGPETVRTLFKAYRALVIARERRQPLDLDMPERVIETDKNGNVTGVSRKERMDAHRLIEEFMVLANVCAAETLQEHDREAIYRVHDAPDLERLDTLKEYLEGLGYSLPKAEDVASKNLNSVLQRAREREEMDIIAMSILRSQSQAVYDTKNIGHFGLSLKHYAHFTSPIRRYADLTVHRGIVRALGLGPGAERDEDSLRLQTVAEKISQTERASIQAERDTAARMLASYLEEQTGAVFPARVSGITRVGLFVSLDETGADGFIPARTLGWERFEHDEKRNAMVSEHSGAAYTLGMPVKVRLLEVTPVQGGLLFEMITKAGEPEEKNAKPARAPRAKKKPPLRAEKKKPVSRHEKAKIAASRSKNKKRRTDEEAEDTRERRAAKQAAEKKAAKERENEKRRGKPSGPRSDRREGDRSRRSGDGDAPAKFERRPRKGAAGKASARRAPARKGPAPRRGPPKGTR
ncbi:ribonuclease R [Parvularcula sp. ZS-1/3]|uniref:Ribonuclease R n=1 Tax=Parvularcula mediterranea TaxID=2732508 RepID=A0A7Y3RLQ8_9PROT|nr:ribonuclease R [Parvularcula mediterranea]NNU16423.1 ribonuclease R [Parvularcula mediterranea]